MGVKGSTYGIEERYILGILWGNLRGRDHLENPNVDRIIIIK